jgi:DNA-binding IclR family transcriptional regulator
VVGSAEPLGIRELARRSALPRSTVGRLVGQLTDLGMVERTDDLAVVAGPGLASLQPDAATGSHLPARLRPLLHELVVAFGENAALSIDDGDALLYVAQAANDHPVRVPDVSGARHHFHLVAPGLLTMAWWPTVRLDNYLRGKLEAPTATSMTTSNELRSRLATARNDGWCWTDQELDPGVNGLAVPILLEDELVATVSLFGPAYRFSPTTRAGIEGQLANLVVNRSAELLG